MPKIFISYRRDDSQYQADRLHAALSKHVSNPKRDIFIDVDNIPVGVDFVEHLDTQVAQCDVLLAVIGPTWLNSGGGILGGRRLDDPKDFVRLEIASALKRGIPVAPILLDGVAMPREDQLPTDLKPLARRNAVEVRRASFDSDTERMIRGLRLREPAKQSRSGSPTERKSSQSGGGWIAAALVLGIFSIIGGGTALWILDPFEWKADVISASTSEPTTPPIQMVADPSIASAATPAWLNVDPQDPAAVRQFLKDQSDSPDSALAKNLLATLDAKAWADALSKNTEAGFKAYLASFPEAEPLAGAKASEARTRIAALLAEPAPKSPPRQKLMVWSFGLAPWPNNPIYLETQSRIATEIQETGVENIVQVYIEQFSEPQAPYWEQIRRWTEEAGVPSSKIKIRTGKYDTYQIQAIPSCRLLESYSERTKLAAEYGLKGCAF